MAIAPGTQGAVDLATELAENNVDILDMGAVSAYMSKKGYSSEDVAAFSETINQAISGSLDENLRRVNPAQELLQEALEEKPYEQQSFF